MKKILQIGGLAGVVILALGAMVGLVQGQAGTWVKVHLILGAALLVAAMAGNLPELRESLSRRALRMGPQTLLQGLLVLIILIFINVISWKRDVIHDFTRIHLFSLSGPTMGVLDNLPGDVEVLAFFPGGGPSEARERLKVYAAYSPKFQYRILDPDKNEEEAKAENVPRRAGILYKYGEKRSWSDNYSELDITNGLIKVTRTVNPKVWFTRSHGEPSLEDKSETGLSVLKDVLDGQGYTPEEVDLKLVSAIPRDVSMVALIGLTSPLAPHEMDLLKQYLARGGNALVMLDPVWELSYESGLDGFLASNGIVLNNNLVRDDVNRLAEDKTGLWLATQKLPKNDITSEMTERSMMFYWVRSLETTPELPRAVRVTPLVLSEQESFEKKLNAAFFSSLATEEEKASFRKGVLSSGRGMAERQGSMVLAYQVERRPDDRDWIEKNQEGETRMVVVGSSSIARNVAINLPYNGEFIVNVFNWLAGEQDLKNLRKPERGFSNIVLTREQKNWVLYISVMILPEVFMIIGLAVWWRRR